MKKTAAYSLYFHAEIKTDMLWFVTGVLRTENHWAFLRTLEGTKNILECFVAPDYVDAFTARMNYFIDQGLVFSCIQKPNRVKQENLQ